MVHMGDDHSSSTHSFALSASHSRPITSKLLAALSARAALAALRYPPGSTPDASSLRAAAWRESDPDEVSKHKNCGANPELRSGTSKGKSA